MRTVGDLLVALEKVDLSYLISLALINSREEFIRLQQEQMLRGEREDGRPIFNLQTGRDQYSPGYAKRKGRSKPIDLRDTGAFQDRIFLVSENGDTFTVDSADSKSGKLQENYGKQIFGLADDSKVRFIPVLAQTLQTDFKTEISK